MTELALDYCYSYLRPSRLDPQTQALQLATFSNSDDAHPYLRILSFIAALRRA